MVTISVTATQRAAVMETILKSYRVAVAVRRTD